MLTPSHLMFGRRIMSLPDVREDDVVKEDGGDVRRRFKYLERMLLHFWMAEEIFDKNGVCNDVKLGMWF